MRIRLTKKLAQALNGVDLRSLHVGETVELNDSLARMLIAERWAEEIDVRRNAATADDRPARRTRGATKKPGKHLRTK